MGNWNIVMQYDDQAAAWLSDEGYQHPPVSPGNRLPTPLEIEEATNAIGIEADAMLLVDDSGLPRSISVRGDLVLQLRLLHRLSGKSGQLWLYPDSGSPAIVIDSAIDPESVAAAWLRSLNAPDPWAAFLGRLGGPAAA